MVTTTHLGMTLVEQSQAQKEITVNQALTRIDAVLNSGAESQSVTAPPGSPASGDLYIVAASATGAWAGHDGELAYFDQIWRFIAPNEGMTLWVNDEDITYIYDGSAWTPSASGGGGGGSGTVTSVSVTTANGVSGSVATATSTPAITLTLGAITPSSVAASGTVGGSNLSGTNTGDQTITLTGDVTGSGTGSFAASIGAGKVTNTMLAGSIAAAKLVGSDIATVGTITSGTWNGTGVAVAYGGTGLASGTSGGVPYFSGSTTIASSAALTSNAIVKGGGAGAAPVASGVCIDSNNNIYGYGGTINAQTGTTYTLASTDAGKIVEVSNASAITVTLPNNLAVGFCCTIVQTGAGQITLSAAGGATLHNRSSFTQTAGQWGVLTLYVTTNAGGSSAVYVIAGDGA